MKADQSRCYITFKEICHLQELEGNPLSPDQIAMFAMFDRETGTIFPEVIDFKQFYI